MPARIVKAAYLGTHMEHTVDCALGSLFGVERTTADPYRPGAGVWISLGKSGITIVRS